MDYKVGDVVWYSPRGYEIIIKCTVTELDDYFRKQNPGAYLFYDVDEPVGHSLADDEFSDTFSEECEAFWEWWDQEDYKKPEVISLDYFRERVIHFIVETHNELSDFDKVAAKKDFLSSLPPKVYGVDWFNLNNIPKGEEVAK